MEVTIEEAIQHIKNSCYIVGYPIHDRQNETRKRINASLDMAIDIMRKYQKIEQIAKKSYKNGICCEGCDDWFNKLTAIRKVLEDGKIG